MRRILLSVLTALALVSCYAHEPDRRDERRAAEHEHHREAEYRDREGRPYRHEHWQGEDVYRLEDGRWYSRRGDEWVIRPEVDIH